MPHFAIAQVLRRLWHDRAITTIALAVLALGIGANTALFTVVDAVLLKPLPYPAADRLIALRLYDPEFRDRSSSFPVNAAHVDTWRERCGSCEALAAIGSTRTTLTGIGESEKAVIGYGLWQRKFSGDRSIVGRSVVLDDQSVTIVGVLPAGAPIPGPQQLGDLVRLPRSIDVFRPAAFSADELRSSGDLDYGVIARLRPGARPDVMRATCCSRGTPGAGAMRRFAPPSARAGAR
jgi:putative ABC transport system permease protein